MFPRSNPRAQAPLFAEWLIAAGGGGQGSALDAGPPYGQGGGGGAGGLIQSSGILTRTPYSVVVGAAGAQGPNDSVTFGADGGNSSFNGQVAIGGGGGAPPVSNGRPGGSGGGASNTDTGPLLGGAGTLGQGYAGGPGSGVFASGAGGGAGGPATQPSGNPVAGPGVASSITGSAVVYCYGGPPGFSGFGTPGSGGGDVNSGAGAQGGRVIIAYRGSPRATGGTIDTTSRPGWTVHIFAVNGTFTPL